MGNVDCPKCKTLVELDIHAINWEASGCDMEADIEIECEWCQHGFEVSLHAQIHSIEAVEE